jgi:hypothetical protein
MTGKEAVEVFRQFRDRDPDADRRPGVVIVTNGYRGVQPIFAIKPGATGDITLKDNATKSDFVSWSTKTRRSIHSDTAHLP